MVVRKITIDNRVKYIPSVNSSSSENSHNDKPMTTSTPRKQNQNAPQSIKKFLKNITAEGFRNLKQIMNCYF